MTIRDKRKFVAIAAAEFDEKVKELSDTSVLLGGNAIDPDVIDDIQLAFISQLRAAIVLAESAIDFPVE